MIPISNILIVERFQKAFFLLFIVWKEWKKLLSVEWIERIISNMGWIHDFSSARLFQERQGIEEMVIMNIRILIIWFFPPAVTGCIHWSPSNTNSFKSSGFFNSNWSQKCCEEWYQAFSGSPVLSVSLADSLGLLQKLWLWLASLSPSGFIFSVL